MTQFNRICDIFLQRLCTITNFLQYNKNNAETSFRVRILENEVAGFLGANTRTAEIKGKATYNFQQIDHAILSVRT